MEHEEHEHPDHHEHRPLTYFVNGERLTTDHHKLTVKAILTQAGFEPVEQYRLERDEGHHIYEDQDAELYLHEDERLTATYLGPTPTS